jgi:small-conductance mechanosensitive channel
MGIITAGYASCTSCEEEMILEQVVYQNPVRSWLYALAVAVAVFLLLKVIQAGIRRRVSPGAPIIDAGWRNLASGLIQRTHGWVLFTLSAYTGLLLLMLPVSISYFIGSAVLAVILYQIGRLGSFSVKFFVERYRRQKIETNAAAATALSSAGFVFQIVLWLLLIVIALDNFGVNVTTLIAGLGIGGIAVALAVQNILGDLFASFSIVLDKPFVIGDFIVVGEFMGTVEHVGLKTTRIRSISGEQLIFSNSDLLKSRIRNFKRMSERRVVFSIDVVSQTPYAKLIAVPAMIREIIESKDPVRFERAHFKEYGPYALNFEVVYRVKNSDYDDYMDIQQAINLEIHQKFEEAGIRFAYPTQTLFLEGHSPREMTKLGNELK